MSPDDVPTTPKRPMTLAEAGRKGGEKVRRERGTDFYAEIGRKGGRRVAQSHGPAFYAEIGRKGGEARRPEGDAARRDGPEAGSDAREPVAPSAPVGSTQEPATVDGFDARRSA